MTQQFATVEISDVVGEFVKSMIKLSDEPIQVVVGLHNAFVHGQVFADLGLYPTDKQLENLFDGLEKMIDAVKSIQNEEEE